MQSPTIDHWNALKRILQYLQGTKTRGLFFKHSANHLLGYADANWASDIDDRKSTIGFAIFLGSNLVSWSSSSRKQKVVSHSSTEAEYISLAAAASEVHWLSNLYTRYPFHLFKVLCCFETILVRHISHLILYFITALVGTLLLVNS